MKSGLFEVPEKVLLRQRLRRLRNHESLRLLFRETRLSSSDFVYPIFVDQRLSEPEEITSMPGIFRLPLSRLKDEIGEVVDLKITAVLLFGLPKRKDPLGSEAYAADGVVQQAVREVKKVAPHLTVATDVCLCQYTDHGHCGVIRGGKVENDETTGLLSRIAVSHAEAGADMVGPSAMMDGQVGAIRRALDERGFDETSIMSYSAKFASSFYGPFREAAESAPQWGDRRSYQMDPPNRREAMREIEMDIGEGADVVMVKPALSYLDLIRDARARFSLPLAAYNVSGEYSMIRAAGQRGWLDEKRIVLEVLTAIKRAGADVIITYFAKDAAGWLREDN
ncbi:MAG TPA: porphobilinogen synthase [Candidatus Dormibacteraeota bacterium]|nr:porphobilinogen synthase [Candidatus Dormibacteraeota bacterium]